MNKVSFIKGKCGHDTKISYPGCCYLFYENIFSKFSQRRFYRLYHSETFRNSRLLLGIFINTLYKGDWKFDEGIMFI